MTTDACTLPTAERPLRLAEFDDLFSNHLDAVERDAVGVRLVLSGGAGLRERVTDLTARESACCSFFTFGVDALDGQLVLDIAVPPGRHEILASLAERAIELSS